MPNQLIDQVEPDQDPSFCSLCGAEMAPQAPWKRWCSDCRRDGLRGWRAAAVAGVLVAAAGARLAHSPAQAALVVTFVLALVFAARVDVNLQLLPDDVTLPLLWVGLLANSNGSFVPLHNALMGAVVGYLALWSLYWATTLATKQEPFGYGDLKLTAALGAWLGFGALPAILIGAAAMHSVAAFGVRLAGLQRPTLPFGPALAGAGLLTMAWRLLG